MTRHSDDAVSESSKPRPLDGVRVLDLSRLLPGPMCTWYLAGLGATVVKVEDPAGGDYLRHVPPFTRQGAGAWFSAINAGKRSVALDLRRPESAVALRALLRRADVLVEGFRPGVMARLGLDPEDLGRRFPRLVVASISGYGQTGPLQALPGHDLGYVGLAGHLSLGHRRQGVPAPPAIQVADMAGGALTSALAITAALFGRERTGRGAWLDTSMTEGALALVAPQVAAAAESGQLPPPGADLLTGGVPIYGVYRCAGGRLITVAAIEPKFQETLRGVLQEAIGAPVPLEGEALAAAFATRTRDEWAALLEQACVTPVLDLHEVLEHPLHRWRGSIVGQGRSRRVRPPFPGAERTALLPCPALGEHTAAELADAGVDPAPFLSSSGSPTW